MTSDQSPAQFSHFDATGNAIMVDVAAKADTVREAVASGRVSMGPAAYELIKAGRMAKGDVLGVARLAGIMAAKKVDQLIPLAHPLNIGSAEIQFDFDDAHTAIDIVATVRITGKTGVEMEALTAVAVTALTIYDMAKAVDKAMVITDIRLKKKTGGKSGTFVGCA